MHVAKTLVTASRSQFVSLQLFFALTESILWLKKPSSASVTVPIRSSQESFHFGGIKLWHRQDAHQRRRGWLATFLLGLVEAEQWENVTGQERLKITVLKNRPLQEFYVSTSYSKTLLKINQNSPAVVAHTFFNLSTQEVEAGGPLS